MSRLLLCVIILCAVGPHVSLAQSDPGGVVINEIMYAPAPASNEFIELYNRADSSVRLDHLRFADSNRSFDSVTEIDTTLAPGEYAVLVRDTSAFHSAFPAIPFVAPDNWDALNNGGDTVVLRHGPSDTVIDEVPYDPSWGGRRRTVPGANRSQRAIQQGLEFCVFDRSRRCEPRSPKQPVRPGHRSSHSGICGARDGYRRRSSL